MKKESLKKFKKIFDEEKNKLLNAGKLLRDDMGISEEDRFDEVDQASVDIEQSMRMRLCNRETLYLRNVEEALKKIEAGTYGECEECSEEIEVKRLLAKPTATYCVGCQEDLERREHIRGLGDSGRRASSP